MRNLFTLFLSCIVLISCQDDVTFNNPGFQATINNGLWKANAKSVTYSRSGSILIKGNSNDYILELNTQSSSVGTYALGTTNLANFASYYPANSNNLAFYTTGITQASVSAISLTQGGTGYITSGVVSTIGGTGTGLKVDIAANPNGIITGLSINVAGNGYTPGDIITIVGGDNNAQFEIVSVSKSGGEIVITENDGATISGNFKFTAFDDNTGEVVSCKDGVFYKLPIQ